MPNITYSGRNASGVPRRPKRHMAIKSLLAVLCLAVVIGGSAIALHHSARPVTATTVNRSSTANPATTSVNSASNGAATSNPCATNTLNNLVLVSISQRHLWACAGSSNAYNTPVVTGIGYLAADLTPVGTYHVYAKETNQVLTGCDSTGCWHDPVSYWMPFLDNQYGAYGFHDATWRPANAFGNISPNSPNASHGCVEMPLAAAAWLYNWAPVGTTVTIES